MKNKIITLLFAAILAVSIVGQDKEPEGDPPFCRGTVEIGEDGLPVPDDPNCIPDPSVGRGWFCLWSCE